MANDDGIWIGTRPTTDEERQQIESGWSTGNYYGEPEQPQQDAGGNDYYGGQMPSADQPIQPQQPNAEAPLNTERTVADHPLADPAYFAEIYNKYATDPNYEDEHYTREQIETLNSEYQYRNQGKDISEYEPIYSDNEFYIKEMSKWYNQKTEDAIEEAANQTDMSQVYKPQNEVEEAFQTAKPVGDWNNLDWIGKGVVALTSNDEGVTNMPDWTKGTQSAVQAGQAALAGAATAKLAGAGLGLLGAAGVGGALASVPGMLIAGGIVGGIALYQALSGKEIPVLNKFLEISDITDTVVEKGLGFAAQVGYEGYQNIKAANEDPNDAYALTNAIGDTFNDMVQNAGAYWQTGEYFYEMVGDAGDFAIDALKMLTGKEGTDLGESWQFNRGINEKQEMAPGTYGLEGMTNINTMRQNMLDAGVDEELAEQMIQQAVINATGSSGIVSDYVAQTLINVDVITTPLENKALGTVSKLTGNDIGVEASKINKGGAFEWLDNYKNLVQTKDVNSLSKIDRILGGVNEDGKIAQFDKETRSKLTDMLPESKVTGVGNIATNVMNAYLYESTDTTDLRNRLASMVGEATVENQYTTGLENSADVNTVRDGLKHAIDAVNAEAILQRYDDSEAARNVLYKVSEELGMEVKDVVSLYENTPQVLEKRLKDYAAKNNNMVGGVDVTNGVDPVQTIISGFSTTKDGKMQAWNIKQVQFELTTKLIDNMAKYYTEYYGVKPDSVINRVFDTMKSAQSILLLGWSPSYFINNVVNNAVTSAADGVFGIMTPKQINRYMEEFGVTPSRMDSDANTVAEFRGSSKGSKDSDPFSKAVNEAKQTDDALSKVKKVLRKTNDKLGLFSNLSGAMEELQGNQLTAVAIQQYWKKRWKAGEGFRLMPTSLVETIEAQSPGMTNIIYRAIEGGLNMDQISQSLYDTYIKPDVGQVMKSVCDELFGAHDQIYEEVIEKTHVMDEIKERFENCKTDEERRTVVKDVQEKIQSYINNLQREELINKASEVEATVSAEGLNYVSNLMAETAVQYTQFWQDEREQWNKAYNEIMNNGYDSKQRRAVLEAVAQQQKKDWADYYKQEAAIYSGIVNGLGFENEYNRKYLGLMLEKQKVWQQFNDQKSQILHYTYQKIAALKDTGQVDYDRISELWEECFDKISEQYDIQYAKEKDYSAKMDAAFVEGYEYTTGKSGKVLTDNFKKIRDIRDKMHDMQQDAHQKTRHMTDAERAEFYEKFNPKYNALIQEIGKIGEDNSQVIDAEEGRGRETSNVPPMNANDTVKATEVKETSDVVREKAMRERQGYLSRDQIKDEFIEAGRTPAEADLMMALYDAIAETWAKNNGMATDEFYTNALRLKGIAKWLSPEARDNILNQKADFDVKAYLESVGYDGDINALTQADYNSIVKGTYEHMPIGNIIRMLQASDVSTMVHESGHVFRQTLSTELMGEFTQWAGFDSIEDYQRLEARYWSGGNTLTEAEKTRFVEAEEKFARGFEQYLMDGSAPTVGLKAYFKKFQAFLLDIYKRVKATVTGNDYRNQGEFVFHGINGDEVLNIRAEINGVKLADIFDRMLTNEIDRMPGYEELVSNRVSEMKLDRHNMRMSENAIAKRAQADINKQILKNWDSIEAAENALKNYSMPWDIDGMKVDDTVLYEAIENAKNNKLMNPFSNTERKEVIGFNTYGYSQIDPNKRYQLRHKIVELDDLIASNEWFGDQLKVNDNYPAELQPRDRMSDQSRNQIFTIASNLAPGKIIDNQKSVANGTPTVGEGNMYVEAGNGRVLALQRARAFYPESWNNYQEYLRNSVSEFGIEPSELDKFQNPVLVRERLGGDAKEFVMDANSRDTLDYSASELSLNDANGVNMEALSSLSITPGETMDTFITDKNAKISLDWLRSLPDSERAPYVTMNANGDSVLTKAGVTRFTNALFAMLYATPESMDILKSFGEAGDSNIQALESALKATLPEMVRAEALMQTGRRDANLSITSDVMKAAGLLNEAREAKQNIHDYLTQQTVSEVERWTPTQALLAGFFGDAKNNTRILKDFFNQYGELINQQGDPNQLDFFSETKTREQIIDESIDYALNRKQREYEAEAQRKANVTGTTGDTTVTGEGPSLHQEVSAKAANTQHTFDEGMAIPFDQVEDLESLRGQSNKAYENKVQRWLRDFMDEKNYSAEQYLYAWGIFEYWTKGKNLDELHGNPLWESKIKAEVLENFASENGKVVDEAKKRYKPGTEIDDTPAPNSGEYVKRTFEFEHGYWNIAGNVYKDGVLIAYLPEELNKMQKTITVDDHEYKVLGIDRQDPNGLVYYDDMLDIVRTVIVGKPENFDEVERPGAWMRGAKQNSTPQSIPSGSAYSELASKYLNPALNAFADAYNKENTNRRTGNSKFGDLDLNTRALIEEWLDQSVKEDMRLQKYQAMKYSDMKKDAVMLNYGQRYGFDPILTILSPYQFWYTRSMWKWAKRMIDKPAWGNMYERMEEMENKNRMENIPSRLEGKFRIPMPFMPDWMGGSYYIDLNSQLFPFSQFGKTYSSYTSNSVLNARAESILNDAYEDGDITMTQMSDAINNKSGELWENAYAQAEVEVGRSDTVQSLVDQYVSPNIFVSWLVDKLQGNESDIGQLSSTRTGVAIKGLTQGTSLEDIGGKIGDALTLPEQGLRKLYGIEYNEFGSLGDQMIRKQISQMCADGEITWRQALNAMNEKSGTIWDMAADRQRKEVEYKVPGFAGIEGVKSFLSGEATLPEALGAMAASALAGGSIYPSGEKTLREQKASRDNAYVMKAAGQTDAVSNWYNENPEYATRKATYISDPEELLKYTLYTGITNTYYAQPYAQQQEIINQLGPEFKTAILDSTTKNYEAVSVQKLAEWNAALGGTTPNVGSVDVDGVTKLLQLSDKTINEVDEYNTLKDEKFPGISVIQTKYFELPKGQRAEYLTYFPQLEEYWEWNRQYKNEHPNVQTWQDERSAYYNEETCYKSYAEMSERTQTELEYVKVTGNELSDAARYELSSLYDKYANANFLSYEDYIELLENWE